LLLVEAEQGIGAPLIPVLGAGFCGWLVVLARFPDGDYRIEIARPPLPPGAGSGESQIGDIGRGSGRTSYHQQPWLSSLSAVPKLALSGKRPRRARRTRVSGRSAPDRVG
jgi:hypothetical protein